MKTFQFKSFFIFACLGLFLVGCGKNGAGNGSSSNGVSIDAYHLGAQGQQALSNLKTWFESSTENQQIQIGTLKEERVTQAINSNTSTNDSSRCILGGFLCAGFSWNFQSNIGSSGGTTKINTIYITPNYLKSSNARLVEALNENGRVIESITQNGSQYTLVYRKTNGAYIRYIVDTSKHSSVNPVQIEDFETMKVDYLRNYYNM